MKRYKVLYDRSYYFINSKTKAIFKCSLCESIAFTSMRGVYSSVGALTRILTRLTMYSCLLTYLLILTSQLNT